VVVVPAIMTDMSWSTNTGDARKLKDGGGLGHREEATSTSEGEEEDRARIESLVATGNTTCPVTRVPLADFTLIPNHTLRRLIQEWCVAHRSMGVERIPTPKQPADPDLVCSLVA
jgi:hypothetical protein